MPKHLLGAGLKVSHKSYEHIDEADVTAKIQAASTKLQAAGFEVTTYLIDPQGSQSEAVQGFTEMLRQRAWDGVGIGFGVRGDAEMTPLFEGLVNAVLENVRPAPKMMFPVGPDQLYEAAMRVFQIG